MILINTTSGSNLLAMLSNLEIKETPPKIIHHISSKHSLNSNKYDPDMSSNEFGTEMHMPELLVILLILCLWVLSLRKLVKHFDKLRSTTTQIPYKYRLKDPENIGSVKIVQATNDSVIYSRDPVKSLRSKSIACGDSYARELNTHTLAVYNNRHLDNGNSDTDVIGSKLKTPLNHKKNLSNSLNSMSNYGPYLPYGNQYRQYRQHSIGPIIGGPNMVR